jgi:hypothetical protein
MNPRSRASLRSNRNSLPVSSYRDAALAAAVLALAPLASGETLLSSNFDAFASSGQDGVRIDAGADQNIAFTGGGSNQPSPAAWWSVANAAELDLAAPARLVFPASLTGGAAIAYGDSPLAAGRFKKGAVFTTRGDFTHTDGAVNALLRYGTASSPKRGYIQLNNGALRDSRFNLAFEIKPGAAPRLNWSVAFRYGTGNTSAGSWNTNTAAQNGAATAAIHAVDPATGAVSGSPVLGFGSVSLAGAGPLANLVALDPGAALGPGLYVLSIRLSGKTSSQRHTLDDLALSADAGSAEVILDDTASTGVAITGTWTTATASPSFQGSGYLHDGLSGKGAKSVRYAPSLQPGVYAVSIRFPAASTHDKNVPVDIVHAQGADYLTIDQSSGDGQWLLLGNYRFGADGGSVTLGTAGTTGLVVADAVKFTPLGEPSDVEVLADGLIDWRRADGDGISCAQCHGPAGYDVAVFSFDQADLRRATAPHLDDAAADRIFKMIELHRRTYPPAGGLKDVATFRPFQPAGGVVLGGANAPQEARDAAFANHVASHFLYAQGRVDTLAAALAARDQLVNLDLDTVPVGLAFNRWSEAVSRLGAQEGGRISEWLPPMGLQVVGANAAAFEALEDAYIANPTDANFWALFHKIDAWTTPDPHNAGPVTNSVWFRMARSKLKSNLVFQHDELLKSQGISDWVTGRTSVRPFEDQENKGSLLSFFWDVADDARIVKNTPFANLPVRHQESMWLDSANTVPSQINRLRNSWFYLGWTVDHSLFFTGPTNPTRSGEYFIEQLWAENLRAHQVFFNIVHLVKRSYQPGAWVASGNFSAPVQHFNSYKPYFLAYGKYKKGNDAPGYQGSAATYKNQLANAVRMMALLHEQDIKDRGVVYTVVGGGKATILGHVELMRQALIWADPENRTQNDAILDSLIATINAYPSP